jgi:hypothetical protein
MQFARDDFLAHTTFTGDQDGGIAVSDAIDHGRHPLHGTAVRP